MNVNPETVVRKSVASLLKDIGDQICMTDPVLLSGTLHAIADELWPVSEHPRDFPDAYVIEGEPYLFPRF